MKSPKQGGHTPVVSVIALVALILSHTLNNSGATAYLRSPLKLKVFGFSLTANVFVRIFVRDRFGKNHKVAVTSKRPADEDGNNTESKMKQSWSRGTDWTPGMLRKHTCKRPDYFDCMHICLFPSCFQKEFFQLFNPSLDRM